MKIEFNKYENFAHDLLYGKPAISCGSIEELLRRQLEYRKAGDTIIMLAKMIESAREYEKSN